MSNILIIGSCAREHSILKKLYSDNITNNNSVSLFCVGNNKNPGILEITKEIKFISDNNRILEFCKNNKIILVVVGPEKYLENGIVDLLESHNIPCIGPNKLNSQIETDKHYCRNLISKYNLDIYNPRYKYFTSLSTYDDINSYYNFCKELGYDYVIKPNGLCSGKGVKVRGVHFDNDLEGLNYSKSIIEKGQAIIIEEKLIGKEFTMMSYTDGINLKHMPVVVDFKLLELDKGPNTGSMGCISYSDHMAPFLNKKDIDVASLLNEKIVSCLYKENKSYYKGILYGSFIKCDGNIKLIEYNARYGDPECVNVLELLETNLLDIYNSIINQSLESLDIRYTHTNIISKYLVPENYPYKTERLNKLDLEWYNINKDSIYCSSVNIINNNICPTDSRTLVLFKKNINISFIYETINKILDNCSGFKYRNDIGSTEIINYKNSGVDIDKAEKIVAEMSQYINTSLNSDCLHNSNDFGGVISIPDYYSNPVLISSIDGVGSKISFLSKLDLLEKLSININTFEISGMDIVGHSINDILVKGADPLFFMDYIASDSLDKNKIISSIKGMSTICSKYNIPILGGETAEMPGIYNKNEMDIAGCIVGITERDKLIDGKKDIGYGDIAIGLYSEGLHTNGFSLIRKLFKNKNNIDLFDTDFVKWITQPHKCYYDEIKLLDNIKINGLVHITGGGLIENPKRVLSNDKSITIYKKHLMNRYFKKIQTSSLMSDYEMYRTLNCGIGMIIILDPLNLKKLEQIYKGHNIGYCELGIIKKKNNKNKNVEFL